MSYSKFDTVEEMIMSLPKAEQVIVRKLRALITECLPQATEKSYYGMGVPFYTHHRLICFIWPPSVYWGSAPPPAGKGRKSISLGFNQGNRMSNEDGALLSEGRKQVYVLYIDSIKDLDENQVRALLFEAGMIDEEFGKKKKQKKRPASPANRRARKTGR
jgi:hypothetical protein